MNKKILVVVLAFIIPTISYTQTRSVAYRASDSVVVSPTNNITFTGNINITNTTVPSLTLDAPPGQFGMISYDVAGNSEWQLQATALAFGLVPDTGGVNILFGENGTLDINGTTITANEPSIDLSQTWNNAGITFEGIKLNITDTASAASSELMDLQVGGSSKFSITKGGAITVSGDITTSGNIFFIAGGVIRTGRGTETSPVHSFNSDTDTGLFAPGDAVDNQVGITVGGMEAIRWKGGTNQTTDATQTLLVSFTIPANRIAVVDANVVANLTDFSAGATYFRRASGRNNAGTSAIVGSVSATMIDTAEDAAMSSCDVTIDVNDANDTIRVLVTGIAATTINWRGNIKISLSAP